MSLEVVTKRTQDLNLQRGKSGPSPIDILILQNCEGGHELRMGHLSYKVITVIKPYRQTDGIVLAGKRSKDSAGVRKAQRERAGGFIRALEAPGVPQYTVPSRNNPRQVSDGKPANPWTGLYPYRVYQPVDLSRY